MGETYCGFCNRTHPGSSCPFYEDDPSALRARVEELEAEHEDQITRICDALIEVGPWDDIDGDGDEAEVIVRHIHQLAAADSSAPDNEGSK